MPRRCKHDARDDGVGRTTSERRRLGRVLGEARTRVRNGTIMMPPPTPSSPAAPPVQEPEADE